MSTNDPATGARRSLVSARGVHVVMGRIPARDDLDHDPEDAAHLLGADAAALGSLPESRLPSYLTARRWVRDIVTVRLRRAWRGFEATPRGVKPRLEGSTLDVSIAHAGDRLVVGVVEHGLIGVDIELVAPVFDQPALVRRLCTPAERRHADGLEAAGRRAWLTQLWAVKESYAKAVGAGLALDFRQLAVADLRRNDAVRGVLTPASGVPHARIAVSWVAAAPSRPPSSVRTTA
ncbi:MULTISPECIES: 4'-phosphopantetheinyl transferase superfamily protein [unclassified Microbacterium]|uniref:4'-phosphopantetheinyl transferase family protein n=1 Tax=unclassified Microbacterium TaxID=2609290 RepID=UPI0013CFED81|nr:MULTISPECIES: 4'-phosphopantetheinyl transferase superfamily protein [unclassified Microbacterium]